MPRWTPPTTYVAALSALAVGTTLLLAWVSPLGVLAPLPLVVAIVAIVVAERTEVDFAWDRTQGSFTVTEVAITALLFLQPPTQVAVAVLPAMALAHAPLWRSPVKIAYNVASPLLATAVAALALIATPTVGPVVAGRPVLGMLLGMLLYGGLSVVSFAGLLTCLQDRRTAADLGRQLPMTVASTTGTTSVGVVTAALWELQPELVPFVLALAVAIHLAQRSSVRAASLLAAQQVQHDRLTRVVDGASDGIALLDSAGRIQVWNPAMERATGRPAASAGGRTVTGAFAGSRHEELLASGWDLATAFPAAPHRQEQATLTGPGGTRRDVLESHAYTFDERGRCTGSVVVVRDVSRQQELERLRSDFVARVSHELRTPLTPIRGFASVLLRRGAELSDEDRSEILGRISERADHLHALVEDLLLVTQLERPGGDQLVGLEATDVAAPTVAAVAQLRTSAPSRLVTVTLADDLPHARAAPGRVEKIAGIVLDNAHRYTPGDTPIEVEVDADDDDVVLRVIDHGPGIPEAHRETVFERFSRLEDPLTMRTGGVGVGLFLGRRLAGSMYGSLTLDVPIPGGGCVFTLRLPRATRPSTVGEHDETGPLTPSPAADS